MKSPLSCGENGGRSFSALSYDAYEADLGGYLTFVQGDDTFARKKVGGRMRRLTQPFQPFVWQSFRLCPACGGVLAIAFAGFAVAGLCVRKQ